MRRILIIIAVGAVIIVLVDLELAIQIQKQEASSNTTNYQNYREYSPLFNSHVSAIISSIWSWIGNNIEVISAGITAIATAIMAIFTGRLWFSTEKLWKTTNTSIDLAREEFTASHRPWISVEISVGDLTYDAQGDVQIKVKFDLKNVGNSPATNVDIDSEFVVVFGDSRPFQKAISDRNKFRPSGTGNLGHAFLGDNLFPGETHTHFHILPISRASIDAFNRKQAADFGRPVGETFFVPTLVGCVDYKFTFAEGRHQTGFILDLRKRDIKNPNIALRFDIREGNIPAERLWLVSGSIGIPPD
jgi:hypothetical protein